ncbi:MAG: hypothetical protein EA397_01675 [Deltaproteobacteria bacterium]|nr:MAG: hypothetical protein EA397_01675 [Deltaproteobacteria bacterium]
MLTRSLFSVTALLLAVGCNATATGTLVDGITGEPVPGSAGGTPDAPLRIIAEAVTEGEDGRFEPNREAGLTCQSASSEVGGDGTFRIPDLCLSTTGYRLRLSDNNFFLGETDFLPQGSDVASLSIKAWHAPMGAGVKILKDDRLARIRSRVSLKSEIIKGTEDQKVFYPTAIPNGIPMVKAGERLVITGMANKDMKLVPVINSGEREFKVEEGMETGPTMNPWSYLGTKFTDDETFERVSVDLDESKTTRVEHRNHYAKFVPAEAVNPPGRYALWVDGQKTAFLVDFIEEGVDPNPKEDAEDDG